MDHADSPGSIGNLASAATVAASSFAMRIKDPQDLIDSIDASRWASLKGRGSLGVLQGKEPHYVEPPDPETTSGASTTENAPTSPQIEAPSTNDTIITGKVQRLGDFVDTDAVRSSSVGAIKTNFGSWLRRNTSSSVGQTSR